MNTVIERQWVQIQIGASRFGVQGGHWDQTELTRRQRDLAGTRVCEDRLRTGRGEAGKGGGKQNWRNAGYLGGDRSTAVLRTFMLHSE